MPPHCEAGLCNSLIGDCHCDCSRCASAKIEQLHEALTEALKLWQEADYHWVLEFEEVCKNWQDHVPRARADTDFAWERLNRILRDTKVK